MNKECGTLYIVGTPIGNMADITLRALDVLKNVDMIACEDTRHTLGLLNKYEISKPLKSYHKFNEKECAPYLIERLRQGQNIALVSDAGMPGISDPGGELIRAAQEADIKTESVPGPSALTTAAALCAVETPFVFFGFLPEKKKEKDRLLLQYKEGEANLIFYVASHDLLQTLEYLYSVLGAREYCIAAELTKLHERTRKGMLGKDPPEETVRGEYVVIVKGAQPKRIFDMEIKEHIAFFMQEGLSKKDAVKKVAEERGISKSLVYQESLKM